MNDMKLGKLGIFMEKGSWKSPIKKVLVPATFFVYLIQCGPGQKNESEVLKTINKAPTAKEITDTIKTSPFTFYVNLKTNRMSYFSQGKLKEQWNVATADVTGEHHDGEPQITPQGIYSTDSIVHCPSWFPSKPVDPLTGKKVTDEKRRFEIFEQYPETYGPCGAQNPLGKYVIWFKGPYGIHGNVNESILKIPDPEKRRVSGGCIRNPNAKIKALFHDVLRFYPSLKSFSEQVKVAEQLPKEAPKSMLKKWIELDARIIVVNEAKDPVSFAPFR
jgi:hypothetical protein